MAKSYDVVVIGAGPAGYVAAIRCTQLGLRTACVDEWVNKKGKPALGGTCLNVGCIPSKDLLQASENYHRLQHQFGAYGIQAEKVSIDIPTMIAHKDRVVNDLTSGIATLFKANKVTAIHGHGRLLDGKRVEISDPGSNKPKETIQAQSIIIASGSDAVDMGEAPTDGGRIVNSTGALEFLEVPKRLGVIGAGTIGLELGSVWRRLGSEVVFLEALDTFLPAVDQQIAKEAMRQFTRQGLDIQLGTRVVSATVKQKQVSIRYHGKNGEQELKLDRLIVAVGRRPNTDNLVSPESGLLLDERGFINVNEECRTNLPDVYAIGDVVRGPMLAHKGSEEGIAVAEVIAGGIGHVNYEAVPWVIYTAPEIAWVGRTEQALKEAGEPYKAGTFPFAANGRARAMEEAVGMVKIVAHKDTDRVLGVHIIGPFASELIAEAVLAIEYSASTEDLARTIHAHPTLSEALHEASLAVDKRALHKAN
ncbi:MAG: dihydrolipoyl dehydrogenase [Proteobacteria bacterium]|nr:MAG: dihydrolipoyl dehydrogenase [Pseudomonadota bacterium]TDJ71892.1 MAG: dihydrolipoyl dehydrogenase [Pseudomonadota bacterium]